MKTNDYVNNWVIVLGGGEGARLRALTTGPDGRSVPKQFCSLDGGPTLFAQALDRARAITRGDRVIAVVSEKHRALWAPDIRGIPDRNLVVQPRNRGTAAGVLLPLLAVAARDPEAQAVLLPSDHYVEREEVLCAAILEALGVVRSDPTNVVLLGVAPDTDTPDLGWILPAHGPTRLNTVERFVEKPPLPLAADLLARGGLWNCFVLAARARSLCDLFAERAPSLTAALRRAAAPDPRSPSAALRGLYERLDVQDFSRDILQGSEHRLRVLEVPSCGWIDLGTPERVAECLRKRRRATNTLSPVFRSRPVLVEALRAHERLLSRGDLQGDPSPRREPTNYEAPPCIWHG
jgi:mannose-1-phosphate guanylyltransferase